MSSGVSNIRSKGNLLNCYEFEWDPSKGSDVYVIVSRASGILIIIICLTIAIDKHVTDRNCLTSGVGSGE